VTIKLWTFLFVGLTFGTYLVIAWMSRVRDTSGFYVAGRGVPATANGMATAADWMSAASFISMAGLISAMGYAGGMYCGSSVTTPCRTSSATATSRTRHDWWR
jgi:cation/acetate symporter